jgi:hypothetical protein
MADPPNIRRTSSFLELIISGIVYIFFPPPFGYHGATGKAGTVVKHGNLEASERIAKS